jgi:proline iminopeptidase
MFAEINGAELFYEEEGEGPPCFVITALGHAVTRRCLSDDVRRRLHLVYVHLRGTGLSQAGGDQALSPAAHAADLDELRVSLGYERVALFGHSAPGLIALEYARCYSAHASHVILIGTPPTMMNLNQVAQAHWDATASDDRKAIRDENFRRLPERMMRVAGGEALALRTLAAAPMYWFDPRFDASEIMREQVFAAGTARLLSETLRYFDFAPYLSAIACPVFVALGRSDFVVPCHVWDQHRAKLADGTFHIFERSGHYPMLEEQVEFDQRLFAWLAANSRRTSRHDE